MNKLKPIKEWTEAIAAGEYDKAILVLEKHLASGAMSELLAGHARRLLEMTHAWSVQGYTSGGSHETQVHHCSFCGSEESHDRKLIAGPGVFICSKCVDMCANVLKI